MADIYCISGLGADERIFKHLNLPGHTLHFIAWKQPEKDETTEHYAQRLAAEIKTENPVLIGVSFGGMMAIEISKLIPVKKIILISSFKTRSEIPLLYRVLGWLKIDKIVPVALLKVKTPYLYWSIGAENDEERRYIDEMIEKADSKHLKWAINKIINWQNREIPANLIHIHGTKDRILPYSNVKADYTIQNGGHLMVMNKAEEISAILMKEL